MLCQGEEWLWAVDIIGETIPNATSLLCSSSPTAGEIGVHVVGFSFLPPAPNMDTETFCYYESLALA